MNIENEIKSVIETKLQEGIIERLVSENLEKGINTALGSLMGSYGDVTKVIEKKIKEVMINKLANYDYSKYIVNLDHTLTEILKNTTLDNKKILENFKDYMTNSEVPKVVKASEIFEKYCEFVAGNVDTSGLEVETDDEPAYEMVTATLEVEELEKKSWSSYTECKLYFECEKDENINFEIRLQKWREEPYKISLDARFDITSLRHLDSFLIYIMKLSQNYTSIEIDTYSESEDVRPEAEPEASFN